MITRKDFFAEMNGASNMYSTFVLINVSADDVIDALNKLEETEDIDLVIGVNHDDEKDNGDFHFCCGFCGLCKEAYPYHYWNCFLK